MGEPEGMVKTVFDAKTGELLGAHMVGAEVTEMIQGYTIARTLETTEAELMHTVFPHPTSQRDDARGGAGRLQAGDSFLSWVGFDSKLVFSKKVYQARRARKSEVPAGVQRFIVGKRKPH